MKRWWWLVTVDPRTPHAAIGALTYVFLMALLLAPIWGG